MEIRQKKTNTYTALAMVLLEQLTCHGLRPSTESWGWTFHFPHPPGSGCTCQTSQVFTSQRGESRCSVCAILLIYKTTKCSQGLQRESQRSVPRSQNWTRSICKEMWFPFVTANMTPSPDLRSQVHWHHFCPFFFLFTKCNMWRDSDVIVSPNTREAVLGPGQWHHSGCAPTFSVDWMDFHPPSVYPL